MSPFVRPGLVLFLVSGCVSGEAAAPPASAPLIGPSHLAQTLSAAGRAAVDRAPVTPLFFGTARSCAEAVFSAGTHFYAVSMRREGHTLLVHGVDQVHSAAPDEGAADQAQEIGAAEGRVSVRGRPATVLVNEGIRSVAWEEDGGFFSLEVECERPFEDVRCTEDSYLLGEAAALVSLRGAR